MRKSLFALFLLILLATSVHAQTKNAATQPQETQWEYLAVSFGKTIFSSPEKMLAYKTIGIQNGSESIDLQSNLDILGRFGWELSSVVGAIGGDQQVILKRKYDKQRSANEYGLIQSGRLIYLKDLNDIIERSLRLAEEQKKLVEANKNKPRLINLDEVEKARKKEESRQQLEVAYKQKFDDSDLAQFANFSLSYKHPYSDDILVSIKANLTKKFLINGNGYHGDEISSYIKSFLRSYRFRDDSIQKYTGVSINIVSTIDFNGESIYVGSGQTSQSYAGSDWQDY